MKLTTAMVLGCALGASAIASAEVKVGDKFVELDAQTDKGKTFQLKGLAGKWVLYSFNASWCGPCNKELPAWDKLAPKFNGKVLFVAVNINNKLDDGKAFIKGLGLKHLFPVYLPDENSPALKAYDPDHMPSTFVMDPKGIIQYVELGYEKGDEDKLAAKLADLIK